MNRRKAFAQNTERVAATTTPARLWLGQQDSTCDMAPAAHGTYPEPEFQSCAHKEQKRTAATDADGVQRESAQQYCDGEKVILHKTSEGHWPGRDSNRWKHATVPRLIEPALSQ